MLLSQECTRVLGVLASPLCPMQAQFLQQPLLGKVIAYLKLRMKASSFYDTLLTSRASQPFAFNLP